MAKECVHCGKKIGFFSKPVEGAYCSAQCAQTAQQQILQQQQQADVMRDEAKVRAVEDAKREQADKQVADARAAELSSCPKCDKGWQLAVAPEEGGVNSGECAHCGLTAEFVRIDVCPICRAKALLVAVDGAARCPRCKHKA